MDTYVTCLHKHVRLLYKNVIMMLNVNNGYYLIKIIKIKCHKHFTRSREFKEIIILTNIFQYLLINQQDDYTIILRAKENKIFKL